MTQPNRLTNVDHFTDSSNYRIYHMVLPDLIPLHWHEFYEISLIIGGRGEHVLNGNHYPLSPGNCFLLTPVDLHEIISDPTDTLVLYNLIFTDNVLDVELKSLLFPVDHIGQVQSSHQFQVEALSRSEQQFQRIIQESKHPLLGSERVILGCLEQILIEFFRSFYEQTEQLPNKESAANQQPINKALAYMHYHFREQMTLEDVAKQAQFAPNYFSQCFRQITGTTFQLYLQNLRLQFAKSLLKIPDLSITEVCHTSGFQSVPHFNRVFKHKEHVSPREYRKLVNSRRML